MEYDDKSKCPQGCQWKCCFCQILHYYVEKFKTQDIMPEVLMGGSNQDKQSKRLKTIDGESYLELSF